MPKRRARRARSFVVWCKKDSFGSYNYMRGWTAFYKAFDALKVKPGESARVRLVRVRGKR